MKKLFILITISLELAKKMKKLGFKQESEFYWIERFRQDTPEQIPYYCVETEGIPYRDSRSSQNIICSAYTVGELGIVLPFEIDGYPLVITKLKDSWLASYLDASPCGGHLWIGGNMAKIEGDTMANAMSLLAIWLKENKKI